MTANELVLSTAISSPPRKMTGALLAILPVASGALMASAFSPGIWTILAWVCLIPLGIALRRGRTCLELYLGLYLGGLAFHLIHLDWLRSGSGASGLFGPRSTQWLIQGMLLAAMWPMLLSVGRRFVSSNSRFPMILLLPIVWIAFEYSRCWLWSVFDATGYPYGQLGLTQVDRTWIAQIADVGGVYAVTAIVAAVNGFGVDAYCWLEAACHRNDERRITCKAIGLVIVIGLVLCYGKWRIQQEVSQSGPAVCLMPRLDSGELSPSSADTNRLVELASPAAKSEMLTAQSGDDPAELLVWSEGVYPGKVEFDNGSSTAKALQEFLADFARTVNATLVIGCDRIDEQSACYNSAAVIDPQGGYVGSYDKLRLVPFNEFYPHGRPRFGPPRRNDFTHGREYPLYTMTGGRPRRAISFAIAICYDTGFPGVFRRYMRGAPSPPDFFVVPAFERHDRKMRLQWKLLALARFRAIETRRAFVRNAESGYSGIIDGNGLLVSAPAPTEFQKPVFLGRMPIDQRTSIYSHLGDWLPLGACGLIVVSLGWQTFRNRATRHIGNDAIQNGNSNAV